MSSLCRVDYARLKPATATDPASLAERFLVWGLLFRQPEATPAIVRAVKHLSVEEAGRVVSWFGGRLVMPLPPPHAVSRECRRMARACGYAVVSPASIALGELVVPRDWWYLTSFEELLDALRVLGARRLYLVSKFASTGLARRLLSVAGSVYLATRDASRLGRHGFAGVVRSGSHRKLLLVELAEGVVAYHGSMNVLAPGRDDYLLAARTLVDARAIAHGLARAFLII